MCRGRADALRQRFQHGFVTVAVLRGFRAESAAAGVGADVAFNQRAAQVAALEGFEVDGCRLCGFALMGGDEIAAGIHAVEFVGKPRGGGLIQRLRPQVVAGVVQPESVRAVCQPAPVQRFGRNDTQGCFGFAARVFGHLEGAVGQGEIVGLRCGAGGKQEGGRQRQKQFFHPDFLNLCAMLREALDLKKKGGL